MKHSDAIVRATKVLRAESDAILGLIPRLNESFVEVVLTIEACAGRVVATGVGKAGIIARKIAATFASTGTPAYFLHPTEALHGDLGMVTANDILLVLSNSGETDELLRILPSVRRIGADIIAITGNTESSLARMADVQINSGVDAEACPLGLAPTASAVAMLAIGDALAMAVMETRGFTKEHYAAYHPGGALGKRLTLRVSDIMRTGDQIALTSTEQPLMEVMFAISKAGAGAAFVIDELGILVGVVTDGDIRRAILKDRSALDQPIKAIMGRDPITISGDPLAVEALLFLEESPRRPGEAPVLDVDGRPIGLIMLKDLLRSGIV